MLLYVSQLHIYWHKYTTIFSSNLQQWGGWEYSPTCQTVPSLCAVKQRSCDVFVFVDQRKSPPSVHFSLGFFPATTVGEQRLVLLREFPTSGWVKRSFSLYFVLSCLVEWDGAEIQTNVIQRLTEALTLWRDRSVETMSGFVFKSV